MAKTVLGSWLAMMIALVACSGTTSSGNGAGSSDQACTDLAGSICDKLASCAPLFIQIGYGDTARCKSRFKLTCPSILGANGSGANATNVEACAQGYSAANCGDILGGNPPSACSIHGSLTPGTACANTVQCSGANGYCNKSGKSCGVCGTLAAAGAMCMGGDCQSGLVCGGGTCVTPGAAGAMCDAGHPCASTLTCVKGTCGQPVGAGGACDASAQNCDSKQGLFCGASMVCSMAQLADAGGACGFSLQSMTFTECKAGGNCKMTAGTLMGTCEAAAADGATCDATKGPFCLSPAVCENGTCKIPDPASCR